MHFEVHVSLYQCESDIRELLNLLRDFSFFLFLILFDALSNFFSFDAALILAVDLSRVDISVLQTFTYFYLLRWTKVFVYSMRSYRNFKLLKLCETKSYNNPVLKRETFTSPIFSSLSSKVFLHCAAEYFAFVENCKL